MPIDPSIAMGIQGPKFDDPMNKLAQLTQLRAAQGQYDAQQRGVKNQNALAELYATGDQSSPDFGRKVYAIDPAQGMAYDKNQREVRKDKLEYDSKDFELASKKYDMLAKDMGIWANTPGLSKPLVVAELKNRLDQGLITQTMFDTSVAQLPDDPAALKQGLFEGSKRALSPEQILTMFAAKPVERTDGATKIMMDENPLSPGFNKPLGAPVQLKASPEAMMTDARTRSEGAQNRAVSMRGQNITAQGQALTDTRERQKTTQEDRKLAVAEGAKVRDANDVLSLLDMVERVDPATGKSILGTATSSYGGNIVDQGARLFGVSTDGSEAAAQAKAVEGALIAKMPKMSGPQSDKDVLLYRQMAGEIGDPTVPEANKRAAAKVIREINTRHAGGNASPSSTPAAASNENAAALAWVRANPNDPRAAAIKAKLGVQ